MTLTITPISKSSLTLTDNEKANVTWDEADYTWDEARGTWDNPGQHVSPGTKTSLNLTLGTK